MRHHNAVLLDYLKAGEIENATAYLEQLNHSSESPVYRQFCENPTANAVLRIYSHKTEQQGISFTVQTVIPASLPVEGTLLSALLSNLLENAVEACGGLPHGARVMTLTAKK